MSFCSRNIYKVGRSSKEEGVFDARMGDVGRRRSIYREVLAKRSGRLRGDGVDVVLCAESAGKEPDRNDGDVLGGHMKVWRERVSSTFAKVLTQFQ